MEKYFKHVEQRKKEQLEAEEKWRTIEDNKDNFFSSVVTPGLEELGNSSKKFNYQFLESTDNHGIQIAAYKLEILDEYDQFENRYELGVNLAKLMNEEDLELRLKNYHTDKEVEFIGNSENFTKDEFKNKLEEMFIELYDRDSK